MPYDVRIPLSQWRQYLKDLTEANLLDNADFFIREGAIVVVGEVI
jgi:hypothetical protein